LFQGFISTYIYPLGWAAFMVACVTVFELFKPGGRDAGVWGRLYNARMFIFIFILFSFLSPYLSLFTSLFPTGGIFYLLSIEWKKETILDYIAATIMYAAVWDFFQYWTHRVQHMVPFLWPFHRVHHSDEAFGASTALRQGAGGTFLGFLFTHVPTLALCGTEMLPAMGATILFAGWGYFNHANIALSLGPITPILSGPQWHRLHHGRAREYYDCNFAAFFPIYDIIFGTYRGPKSGEYPETGVDDGPPYDSAMKEAFAPAFPLIENVSRRSAKAPLQTSES
jgi:sterol desaturase/sphingolipid hydroxylase (fatty acid hydroxylase superfamily)